MARRFGRSRITKEAPVRAGALVDAVTRAREGEQLLALIDPAARSRDARSYSEWLTARLTISELPRLLFPRCDERCASEPHHPDRFVVLADLALDPTEPRRASWWEIWNETLERELREGPIWFAGSPALPATSAALRLEAGTQLTRITVTHPFWVHYDAASQETLFRIASGAHEGESLITVTFGTSPLLPALAGVLIAPDHPPVWDRAVAVRLLAAGWAAVERGLPNEE